MIEILAGIVTSTPECAALFAPDGKVVRAGRRRPPARAGRRARAARRRGTGAVLHRATSPRRSSSGWRERGGIVTAEDLAAYEVVDRDADPGLVSRAGGGHQSATVGRRDPDRPRALAARRRARRPRRGAGGRDDGANPGRAHARVPRGPRRSRSSCGRFLARRSPLGSTTHVAVLDRDGLGVLGHVLERLVLGRGRARHRRSPEQHARRAGPQPARLPPPSAGAAAAEHDVADRGAARRRARAGARQRRLEPDPLGDPADDHPRDRRRVAGGRGGARRHGVHFEDGVVYAEPGSTRSALERAGRAIGRFRELNLFFGGVQAAARDGHGRLLGRR